MPGALANPLGGVAPMSKKAKRMASRRLPSARRIFFGPSPVVLRRCETLTADFSVTGPYRMMATEFSSEKSNRPIVYAWCPRADINATRCETLVSKMLWQRAG